MLGTVDVVRDHIVVPVSSATQRRMLALLATQHGHAPRTRMLTDELGISAGALHTTISRLRGALGARIVLTRNRGYQLGPDTDAAMVERLLAEEDGPGRLEALRTALELWRGPAYDEFAAEEWARAHAMRLNELLNGAAEDWAERQIVSGHTEAAIAYLEAQTAREPLRDRARGLLMEALAAAGRQADALGVFRDYHQFLAEEMGTEPSSRVADINQRIATAWTSTPAVNEERLPSGNVAILFTTVINPDALWALGERAMREALETHDKIVAAAREHHVGVVFRAGDGVFGLAFTAAAAAASCAVEIQRLLVETEWPDGLDFAVGMGIHVGEVHRVGSQYFGPAVATAELIAARAGREEVLLSATADDALPDEVRSVAIPQPWSPAGTGPAVVRALVDPSLRIPGLTEPDPVVDVEGERRQITVLAVEFDDAQTKDPEELLDAIEPHVADARAAIQAAGGHLTPSQGPTTVAYFGYPKTLEDGARRALRVAHQIATSGGGRTRSARAGVHTGLAVVAGGGDQGPTAAPQVHSRVAEIARDLHHVARAGEVVLSHSTLRIAGPGLSTELVSGTTVSGLSEPPAAQVTEVHRLTAPVKGPSRPRFFSDALVGRSTELGVLYARAAAAADGAGQAVTLIGGPGIGKSRLVAEVIGGRRFGADLMAFNPGTRDSDVPYSMLRRLITARHGWSADDSTSTRVDDLLDALDGDRDAATTLAHLFDIQQRPDEPRQPIAEAGIIRAATRWLIGVIARRVTGIVVEDLQWLDSSSRAVLQAWVHAVESAPVLLLMTARPEFAVPWASTPGHTLLRPSPLNTADTRELIAGHAPGRSKSFLAELAVRSDGVPLFALELAAAAADAATDDPVASRDVPATLQDLLDARLQRAGPARVTAQIAAVLGRSFDASMLATVSGQSARRTEALLGELIAEEIIRPTNAPEGPRHEFRHALVHQAAYDSLLGRNRRDLHKRVAETLSAVEQPRRADHAVIAHHWRQAEMFMAAAQEWELAAVSAMRKAASLPAARFFALAAESREMGDQLSADDEVRLLLGRIEAISMGTGWGSPELTALLHRLQARSALCTDTALVFETMHRLAFTAMVRGQITSSLRLAEDLHAYARDHDGGAALGRAEVVLTGSLMNAGHLQQALTHARAALDLVDAGEAPVLAAVDAALVRCYGAMISLLVADDPVVQTASWTDPLARAIEDGEDPLATMFAHMSLMIVADQDRDHITSSRHADELVAAATTYGIPTLQAMARCYGGQSRAHLGDPDGLEVQLEGLQAMRAQGMFIGQIGYWSRRAELLLDQEDLGGARAAVAYAGSEQIFFEQRLYVPDYWLARARVSEAVGDAPEDVARCYAAAIEVAAECGMTNVLTGLRREAGSAAMSLEL